MTNNFYFICGAGKCGTTLVKCMLDGNKCINVYPVELTNLIYQLNKLKKDKNKQKCYNFCKNFLKLKNEKINILANELYINLNKTLEKILNIINNHLFLNDKPTVFDVTDPSSFKYLKYFKNSKVIHLIRAPADSLNSQFFERYIKFKNLTSLNKWAINTHLSRMDESFKNIFYINKTKKYQRRFLLIKLENLQREKDKYIKIICQFLNIKNLKSLSQLTLDGKNYYNASNLVRTRKIKMLKHNKNYLTNFEINLANNIKYANNFYTLSKEKNVSFSTLLFIKRNFKFMFQLNVIRFLLYSFYGYKSERNFTLKK